MKKIRLIFAIAIIWACLPSFVSAHAYIAQSTPYGDAELAEAPPAIRIKFTEKIDTKLSNISLKSSSGTDITGKLSSDDELTLVYTIPKLDKGIYEVSWQVLSLDSHITDGSFKFAVGVKLEAVKPDDTVSLDGASAGNTGSSSGNEAKVTDKPVITKSPEPTIKPKPTKKPDITPTPSASPTPTAESIEASEGTAATPSPTISSSEEVEAAEPDTNTNTKDVDADAVEDDNAAPQIEQDTANDHSSHSNHSGDSGAGEAEHDHAGGQGFMVLMRILDILTAVILAGILFFRYVIWRDDESKAPFGFSVRAERLVMGAAALIWLVSGLLRLSMLADQFGGVSIYALANGTMIGKIATLRVGLALIALLLAFAPIRERRWANMIKWITAAALIVSFPLTGHANAALTDVVFGIVTHTVHMSAAAIWFGGLAGLLSITFHRNAVERLNQAAVRFAKWALPSMIVILISGIWLSAARLSEWGQLFTTAYGNLILAKTILMLLVVVIAALHKLVFMPQIAKASAARGLLYGIRIEMLLAVALFVLAGWLSTTSPPEARVESKLAEPIYWHVMGEQAHMSLRISENDQTGDQAVRLDLWLPEDQGTPLSAEVAVKIDSNQAEAEKETEQGNKIVIPLELQPMGEEMFEFPGFTKYTYRSSGEFIDDQKKGLITVDVKDEKGNNFHYERAIGDSLTE
ncbi:copper resistance protein CopC [Paenibacillus sp. TAF43_2]|uniref:copper resistance CopC/CopD family protein n=1 Tax=Paenibacillus sp. TAF43_2 TaxID=3233069 RepID=UPI003F9C3C67